MSSSRPYLVRSLYEWILDNDCTPYILVNALDPDVEVPQEYVKDGQIILNISPTAVEQLQIENESLHFDGRFAGMARQVFVSMDAVLGIYAKENGQGMLFDSDSPTPKPPGDDQKVRTVKKKKASGKPSLKLVK